MVPYVSIDTETTGLNPITCQVLEIGAVIDDWVSPIEQLPVLRIIVKLDEIKGNPYALSMHPELLRNIALIAPGQIDLSGDPTDPVRAMTLPGHVTKRFNEWLARNGIDTTKGFQPAGKNFASFDKPFLEENIPRWKADVKIKHRTIDPGNLFWRPGDEFLPDTKECYKRAGVSEIVAHTAVEDAIGVVRLIRAYKSRFDMVQHLLELEGKACTK